MSLLLFFYMHLTAGGCPWLLTGAMCACLMQRAAKIWKNVIDFGYRAEFAV